MLYLFSSRQSVLLPGPGVCDSILPLAFSLPSSPLPSSLLSVHSVHGVFALGRTVQKG